MPIPPTVNAEILKTAVLSNKKGELDAWLEVNDENEVREAIRFLLKLQDRDTRHACAEAVQELNSVMAYEGSAIQSETARNALDRARSACMNARAV